MRKLFLTVGLGIAFLGANAQTANPELVSSSGDSFNNTSYQLDWSIGELQTETYKSGSFILSQGFHQNTYIITAIENSRTEVEMSVYPNPTSDLISLNFAKVSNFGKVSYTVTDFSGRVLQAAEIKSDLEQINFSNYAVGTYVITVLENNQLIKSFKIIKN